MRYVITTTTTGTKEYKGVVGFDPDNVLIPFNQRMEPLELVQSGCMHDNCSSCHGSGMSVYGGMCVHMMSCPCPKCRVTC